MISKAIRGATLTASLAAAACGAPVPLPLQPLAPAVIREPGRPCRPIFYKPRGALKPQREPLHGPGLVLGGGGLDVKGEFVWIQDTIAGAGTKRAGDLVVLRATGNNDYDRYIYRIAPYRSVRTLLIPTCSDAQTLRAAAAIVERSGAVWFAGGNQADYVIWKHTPIQQAVEHVYAWGGVVGGTSAGEAILGQYVFDAVAEGDRNTRTENAVRHPWERIISFTYGFFRFPALRHVITDQHFVTRNRFGRTAVFMARQIADGRLAPSADVLGVGVDEAAGIVVDKRGIGTLLLQGTGGSAFLIRGGPAKQIVPGLPFISGRLVVTKLSRQGDSFDFNSWCGREPTYEVRVDGSQREGAIYTPHDPYKPPKTSRIPKC
ncbi:MAG TPA: cyanophycinase [Candidatus Cybelea sp.]